MCLQTGLRTNTELAVGHAAMYMYKYMYGVYLN